jgi:MarR family transcriptional regulator, temperature-dependent positive regulator of motility
MQKRAKNASSLGDVVFHILHRASQRADDLFVGKAGKVEVTPRQFAVLMAVAEGDNPSQTDLVDATGIDRSTLAELVPRLVKKGLLKRRRNRANARAYIVALSAQGRAALKSTQAYALRADAELLKRLSGEQRRALVEALKVISVRD